MKPSSYVYPVLVTPFMDTGEIDFSSFDRQIRHLNSLGLERGYLFGIAGEFYKISEDEKTRLAETFLSKAEFDTFLTITDHSTYLAVQRARHYQEIGASGLMLLPPFFMAPDQNQIQEHVYSVLKSVDIPVVLQVAGRETGQSYQVDKLLEWYNRYPHLEFNIEGNPLPNLFVALLLSARNLGITELKVANGNGGLYLPQAIKLGCTGIMTGPSFVELYQVVAQELEEGIDTKFNYSLKPYLEQWMTTQEHLTHIEKHILKARGILHADYCRAPSSPLKDEEEKTILSFLEKFEDLLPRWLEEES